MTRMILIKKLMTMKKKRPLLKMTNKKDLLFCTTMDYLIPKTNFIIAKSWILIEYPVHSRHVHKL